MRLRSDRLFWKYAALAALLLGCASATNTAAPPTSESSESASIIESTTTTSSTTTTTRASTTSSTIGEPTPSPAILSEDDLEDRRLDSLDILDPPPSDAFLSEITYPAPEDVLARSTWSEECPVGADELAYAQVSFYGFDGDFHTGELLLNETYAEQIVAIFEQMHSMRFPIEQMQVVSRADLGLGATPTENNTSAFTCRRSVSSSRWSRHAYGDAIDINPFHNPYVSNTAVIPELATAYVDRSRDVPGLINEDIRLMFAEIGWGWGGEWNSVKDWMHFSATGG